MKYIALLLFFVEISLFATIRISIEPNLKVPEARDIIYNISEALKTILDKDSEDTNGGGDWEVLILRERDNVDIKDPELMNNSNNFDADLYIDLKVNTFEDESANGIETCAKVSQTIARELGRKVQRGLVRALGLRSRADIKDLPETWFGSLSSNTNVIVPYLCFYTNSNDKYALKHHIQDVAREMMYALQKQYFNSDPYDPKDDKEGPKIEVTSHSNNSTVATPTIQLKGRVTDYSEIESFRINNEDTNLVNGDFIKTINLLEGNNEILFYAEDNRGNSSQSTLKIKLVLPVTDNEGPIINLTSHSDNSTVTTSNILLKGTVTDSSEVAIFKINNNEVGLNGRNFSKLVELSEGKNEILFYAEDNKDNETQFTIKITYNVPATDTEAPIINIESPQNNKHFKFENNNITISGRLIDDSNIKSFKINNMAVILSDDKFSYNTTLVLGANHFTFEAFDEFDNRSTDSLTLYLDEKKTEPASGPTIDIESPEHASETTKSLIITTGQVKDKDGINYFTINDTNVELDENNKFSFNIVLKNGENLIQYKAVDNLNNITQKTLLVTYKIEFEKDEKCSFNNNFNSKNNLILILALLFIISIFRKKYYIKK